MNARLDPLRRIPIFASLPDELLTALARVAPEVHFAQGEFVFHDGEPGLCMYAILRGVVEIFKVVGRSEIVLATLGEGEIFGEMALLEDSPRSASARATTDVSLIQVNKNDWLAVMSHEPRAIYEAARLLSARLRETDQIHIGELRRKNQELAEVNRRLEATNQATLLTLSHVLDLRDQSTEGHSQRVTSYSVLIAEELGVSADLLQALRLGALLHDIGKIGVSDRILYKRGELNEEEWQEMRQHPLWGKQIVENIEFLQAASDIIYCHHERVDGQGYPRGLRGEEIPLGARIFAVADAFDALTMERPYQPALDAEIARDEIVQSAGTHFDPEAVGAFLRVFPRIKAVVAASQARVSHRPATPVGAAA